VSILVSGETGQKIRSWPHSFDQTASVLDYKENYLLASADDGAVAIINANLIPQEVRNFPTIGRFLLLKEGANGFYGIAKNGSEESLVLLDKELNIIQLRPFDNMEGVTQTSDNGYVLVGEEDGYVTIIKTNSLGQKEWSKAYNEGKGWKIIQTQDEGFAVVATVDNQTVYFLKTDSEGETSDKIQKLIPTIGLLEVNNTRSVFHPSGLQFYDDNEAILAENEGHFELNPGSKQSTIFAGGLWLGGKDVEGNTYVAAQSYSSDPLFSDFQSGIIGDSSNFYNQIWKVNRTEIDSFLNDFEDGILDNAIPFSVLKYPAKGNPYASDYNGKGYQITQDLAPFIDVNMDNVYNPFDGDYPALKGDQMLFWVANDNKSHNNTGGEPLNVEIYYTAYGYSLSTNPLLKNTIFLEADIVNKSSIDYVDFQIGQWQDADLGCSEDDFIGSNPLGHFFYSYNGDEQDNGFSCDFGGITPFEERIPIQTTMFLNQELNAFSYYQHDNLARILGMQSPINDLQHYNFLMGKWRDGLAISKGGDGYDFLNNDLTTFAFSGNPFSSFNDWTMCQITPFEADLRTIGTSGAHFLPKDGKINLALAFSIFENIPHPCPDIRPIEQNLAVFRCFFYAGNIEDVFEVNLGNDTTITSGDVFKLDAGEKGVSYKWSHLEIDLPPEREIEVFLPGIYQVTVTAANGCEIKDEIIVDQTTSLQPKEDLDKFSIHPNPTSELINITIASEAVAGTIQLQLVNHLGQLIKQQAINLQANIENKYTFSVTDIPPGTYFIHLLKEGISLGKKKVIVIR
jgi:hypothetical protein